MEKPLPLSAFEAGIDIKPGTSASLTMEIHLLSESESIPFCKTIPTPQCIELHNNANYTMEPNCPVPHPPPFRIPVFATESELQLQLSTCY